MNPGDWLARFAVDDAAKVAQQERVRAALAAKVNRIQVLDVNPIQVLESGRESDSGFEKYRRSGAANGWAVRVVVSLVAHPSKGIVSVETMRARRHDERVFAAWWAGTLDCAWYFGPTGTERLGGVDTKAEPAQGPVPIVSLTVPQMLAEAKARGLVIPTKDRKRDQVIATLIDHGIVLVDAPAKVRSILDVFDGIQLMRH